MKIEIELLTDSARLPVYSTDEAAGADLCSDEAVMHQSCERREHFDLPVGAHSRNVSANTRGVMAIKKCLMMSVKKATVHG